MRIRTNITALNTSKNLKKSSRSISSSLAKLSSGYSIDKAADNAAGLAISEKMRSQIRGMEQASDNATDGLNMLQTAEGYMGTINNILQRMRELAVQSANGTYDTGYADQSVLTRAKGDRAKINEEIQQLTDEIDRIANTAHFNGTKISGGAFAFQVGANARTEYYSNAVYTEFMHKGEVFDTLNYASHYLDANNINEKIAELYTAWREAEKLVDDEYDIIKPMYNTAVADGFNELKTYRSELISVNNALSRNPGDTSLETQKTALETEISNLESKPSIIAYENEKPVYSSLYIAAHNAEEEYQSILRAKKILDTGYCFNHENFYWAGDKMGNKNAEVIAFTLDKFDSYSLGVAPGRNGTFTSSGGTGEIYATVEEESFSGGSYTLSAVDVTVQAYANQSIQIIDNAIDKVTSQRAFLGAMQNRFEYTIENLSTAIENTTASESTIRDTDMVSEMMEYTKNNLLNQAATAIMAQANTLPQMVMQLLQ